MGTLNIWVGQLLGWKDIIFYTQLPCWLTQLVVYPNCLALDFPCPIFSEMCCSHEFEINAYNDISPKRMKLFFFNNLNIVFVLLHINCVACMFYISFNFVFIYDLLNVPTFFELLLYSFVWNYNEIYCKSAYQRLVQRLGSLQSSEGGVQCESESSILLLQWFCIWRWSCTRIEETENFHTCSVASRPYLLLPVFINDTVSAASQTHTQTNTQPLDRQASMGRAGIGESQCV